MQHGDRVVDRHLVIAATVHLQRAALHKPPPLSLHTAPPFAGAVLRRPGPHVWSIPLVGDIKSAGAAEAQPAKGVVLDLRNARNVSTCKGV